MIDVQRAKTITKKTIKQIFLILMAIVIILPFFWMVLSSFKSNDEVFDNTMFFPRVWHFSNYSEALSMAPFGVFFKNSIIVTFIAVLSQLITCSLAGFAFAKIKFKFRNIIFTIFIACMMIPNEATIISNYMTVHTLGFMNSYIGLVITSLTSVFGIFLMRQFFMTVPNEFLEAASLDGCGMFRTFLKVFLPMGKSALATIGVFGMIASWNDYMWPMIITNSTAYKTVQTGIRYFISEDVGSQWGYVMAMATVIVLPIVIIFIFLQKYFIQGITKVGLK